MEAAAARRQIWFLGGGAKMNLEELQRGRIGIEMIRTVSQQFSDEAMQKHTSKEKVQHLLIL